MKVQVTGDRYRAGWLIEPGADSVRIAHPEFVLYATYQQRDAAKRLTSPTSQRFPGS
jgi:hypothetical protein